MLVDTSFWPLFDAMTGRKFIDSTVPSFSCYGRVQTIRAGGPTTLRSNFRNRTSKLRRSVLYIVRVSAAKTTTGEIKASKYRSLSLIDTFLSHNAARWQINAFDAACKCCSTSCRFLVTVGIVNMQPSYLWHDCWSRSSICKPTGVDRNDGGWAIVVITVVFPAFNTSPTWYKHTTSLSKSRPASMYVAAKIKSSSANRRSKRVGPPSPKSNPRPPTVRRHMPIAISNTAQNTRGLNTHLCPTPRLMSNSLLLSLVPAICRFWFLYKFCKNLIIWSLIPCWDKTRQSDGQCTQSKACDKS